MQRLRQLRQLTLGGVLAIGCTLSSSAAPGEKIRVLVWDEQQPRQKPAYPEFLGKQIAKHLASHPKLEVRSASLGDPEQGLSQEALDRCDVLLWWGHVRQHEISEETGKEIVRRIQQGRLALITLHSAHWSVPFMEAMEARAAQDALSRLPEKERRRAKVTFPGERERKTPEREKRPVLATEYRLRKDGSVLILIERPNCVFPTCCDPVEPSTVRTLLPEHPVAEGIPASFVIPETEMYDEPFHVPCPDQVIFEEWWKDGEHFRSGAVWNIGKGKVFYFRPGHETYRVFFEPLPLKVLENAALWLGASVRESKRAPPRESRSEEK